MSMLRSTPNTFTVEESAGLMVSADSAVAMRQLRRYMASSSARHRARSDCTHGRDRARPGRRG